MAMNRLIFSALLSNLFVLSFVISGVIVNFVQAFLFFTLRFISKYLYRKVNYYLAYSLHSQLVFLAEWWSGTDIIFYINEDDYKKYYGKEHGFLLMNHRYDVDWLIGWIFCERIKLLGNVKAYAKKQLKYIPTLGWAWLFGEFVFLERNWEKDRLAIGEQIAELVEYPDPIWLLLFAEGTRFTTEKHEASKAFAREHGLYELKQHLTPRTRGFTASLPVMRGKIPSIYDVQVAFKEEDKLKPTIGTMLSGKPLEAHMFVERIPLENVPASEEEQVKWLRNVYLRKDKMMDSFLKTGDWFKESGVTRVKSFRVKRRYFTLLNTMFWCISINCPLVYLIFSVSKSLLSSLTLTSFLLCASIWILVYLIFHQISSKLIDATRSSKGSSYGKR